MSGAEDPDVEVPFEPHRLPFEGFEVTVITDRQVYAAGDTVRITVSATNAGARFAEHVYPGWQRFTTTVHDGYHRVVASDEVTRTAGGSFTDRWLPGQMLLFPLYWAQHEGPLVPAWSDEGIGPRVEPGRYRVRVTWLGREDGATASLAESWSPWFEVV